MMFSQSVQMYGDLRCEDFSHTTIRAFKEESEIGITLKSK